MPSFYPFQIPPTRERERNTSLSSVYQLSPLMWISYQFNYIHTRTLMNFYISKVAGSSSKEENAALLKILEMKVASPKLLLPSTVSTREDFQTFLKACVYPNTCTQPTASPINSSWIYMYEKKDPQDCQRLLMRYFIFFGGPKILLKL